MKNLIGGLFPTQESANLAYEALQNAGFPETEIHMFVHRPKKRTERAMEVSVQDIARNAFVGGLIGGAIGGFIGFLVGTGQAPMPSAEPGTADLNAFFLTASLISGVIVGGLIGILLGAASRLLMSRERAEVMTRQIEKRGVLLTVGVNDTQSETRARRVMEEHGAQEIGNPSEKWDLDAWFSPNEVNPSLAHLVNTR
jgi:predicted lipid-binding transport protein (Tim44 family)